MGGYSNFYTLRFFYGNVLKGNRAKRGGGGVFTTDSRTIVSGNSFIANHADENGGGMLFSDSPLGAAKYPLIGNVFSNNTAGRKGGGLQVSVGLVDVFDSDFVANSANNLPDNLFFASGFDRRNLNAEQNWWGTTDPVAIEEGVIHSTDDADLGTVDFIPFRSTTARQSATITPSGGSLQSADNSVTISIPASAVTSEGSLSYTRTSTPTLELTAGRRTIHSFIIQASTNDLPLTSFVQPATIVLNYTDGELQAAGVTEASLDIVTFDGKEWRSLLPCSGCAFDYAANKVTINTNRMGEFALTGGQLRLFVPLVKKPR
jgi:hypothetical protein